LFTHLFASATATTDCNINIRDDFPDSIKEEPDPLSFQRAQKQTTQLQRLNKVCFWNVW